MSLYTLFSTHVIVIKRNIVIYVFIININNQYSY